MRRMMVIPLVLACFAAVAAGCSSDGDSADGSTTTSEGDQFTVVDGESSTTTKAPTGGGGATSTTVDGSIPDGGDPEEFCVRWEGFEREFEGTDVYTASMVTAIRSLRPYVPESLTDDIDVAAQVYAGLIGMSIDQVANDPTTNASVYTGAVVASLDQLELWAADACGRTPPPTDGRSSAAG